MNISLFQLDAFTGTLFRGNPAAVCPLDTWLDDSLLQSIAAENNLSETAFLARRQGGFDIRWFTPADEVDLCGHATLASAYVLFHFLEPSLRSVEFGSRSGRLRAARRDGDLISLDFPRTDLRPSDPMPALSEALGAAPQELWIAGCNLLALFASEGEVRSLRPDMPKVAGLECQGVIATAAGTGCDFVSRYFAPRVGVPEDPVTGSSHCALIPLWAERLGKDALRALQVSARGGEIFGTLRGDRVDLAGRAVLYLRGTIDV
jgi:PhzF family phenazine biosynthesis protein